MLIMTYLQRSGSHCRVWMFISMVRLALVTSVTCLPPFTPPGRFLGWWEGGGVVGRRGVERDYLFTSQQTHTYMHTYHIPVADLGRVKGW